MTATRTRSVPAPRSPFARWDSLPRLTDPAELDHYGLPVAAVRDKVLTGLADVHVEWINHCPLALVATASSTGQCDVSPKGDPPGFIRVLDELTLAIPERPGNRRMDGFRNVLSNPRAGLLLLIPGRPETLRVNGHARVVTDGPFFDDMVVRGHRPKLALLIHVDEVFFHCPRAFQRSHTWRPAAWDVGSVRPYPEIAHALWRSESSLEDVRRHYASANASPPLYADAE